MTDLNQPNEYGVPLHACNGHRQDEHYWAWLGHLRSGGVLFVRANDYACGRTLPDEVGSVSITKWGAA